MKNLSSLFASELIKKGVHKADDDITTQLKKVNDRAKSYMKSMGNDNTESVTVEKASIPQTLLQLSTIPKAINLELYKNPHSSDNPLGDYKSAYRFSMLANPIPLVTSYYDESLNRVDKIWGSLIYGATSTTPYTQYLLEQAQNTFNTSGLSGMGGIPETWYPVYAEPSDWYTLVEDENNMVDLEIDMSQAGETGDGFITLNSNDSFSLRCTDNNDKVTENKALHSDTNIKSIKLKVLRVDFVRPWIDFQIFNQKTWKIEGLQKDYFSNGTVNENKGVFPLITSSMLVGTKVVIEGDFESSDVDMINNSQGANLSIGPFLLNDSKTTAEVNSQSEKTIVTSTVKQIVGYLSKIIPEAPSLE